MIQSLRKSLRQVFLLILYDDAKQVELKMLKVTHCKKRKKKSKTNTSAKKTPTQTQKALSVKANQVAKTLSKE